MQVRFAILSRGAWAGLSETLIFQQRLEGDEAMSHRSIWGHGKEVSEPGWDRCLMSRRSKEPEVMGDK